MNEKVFKLLQGGRKFKLPVNSQAALAGGDAALFQKEVGYDPNRVRTWRQRVTPELAEAWLKECSIHNRHLRARKLDEFERAIGDDLFPYTGETFIFDEKGKLLNGYHRLKTMARMKGKKGRRGQDVAIWVHVVFGVCREDALPVLDNVASRHFGDRLSFDFKLGKHAKSAAAIAVLFWQYDRWASSPAWASPSYVEMRKFFRPNQDDIMWANETISPKMDVGGGPKASSGGAPVLAAFAFARCIDPDRLEGLATSYATGEFGKKTQAMRELRSYVRRLPKDSLKSRARRWTVTITVLMFIEQLLNGKTAVLPREKDLDPAVVERLQALREGVAVDVKKHQAAS